MSRCCAAHASLLPNFNVISVSEMVSRKMGWETIVWRREAMAEHGWTTGQEGGDRSTSRREAIHHDGAAGLERMATWTPGWRPLGGRRRRSSGRRWPSGAAEEPIAARPCSLKRPPPSGGRDLAGRTVSDTTPTRCLLIPLLPVLPVLCLHLHPHQERGGGRLHTLRPPTGSLPAMIT